MAHFNDSRCVAGGVCPTDPLLFTCGLKEVSLLRVVLPTGDHEYISLGDSAASVLGLPAGLTAESICISEVDEVTRNIFLALSIANASLLEGGEIKCYDSLQNRVMAGCPLQSKPQCRIPASVCRIIVTTIFHNKPIYCLDEKHALSHRGIIETIHSFIFYALQQQTCT